jgi:hypothetical protein
VLVRENSQFTMERLGIGVGTVAIASGIQRLGKTREFAKEITWSIENIATGMLFIVITGDVHFIGAFGGG